MAFHISENSFSTNIYASLIINSAVLTTFSYDENPPIASLKTNMIRFNAHTTLSNFMVNFSFLKTRNVTKIGKVASGRND